MLRLRKPVQILEWGEGRVVKNPKPKDGVTLQSDMKGDVSLALKADRHRTPDLLQDI